VPVEVSHRYADLAPRANSIFASYWIIFRAAASLRALPAAACGTDPEACSLQDAHERSRPREEQRRARSPPNRALRRAANIESQPAPAAPVAHIGCDDEFVQQVAIQLSPPAFPFRLGSTARSSRRHRRTSGRRALPLIAGREAWRLAGGVLPAVSKDEQLSRCAGSSRRRVRDTCVSAEEGSGLLSI